MQNYFYLEERKSMINAIDNVVNAISGVLYQPYIVPLILVLAGLYFTIRLGLIQVSLFGESIRVVSEKPVNLEATSSFGALMVSTASRVGTGNIMGVSTALCWNPLWLRSIRKKILMEAITAARPTICRVHWVSAGWVSSSPLS